MKHKDYLNWLKENDPITYHELTSNPTGAQSESDGISILLFILLLIIIISFIMYLTIPFNV